MSCRICFFDLRVYAFFDGMYEHIILYDSKLSHVKNTVITIIMNIILSYLWYARKKVYCRLNGLLYGNIYDNVHSSSFVPARSPNYIGIRALLINTSGLTRAGSPDTVTTHYRYYTAMTTSITSAMESTVLRTDTEGGWYSGRVDALNVAGKPRMWGRVLFGKWEFRGESSFLMTIDPVRPFCPDTTSQIPPLS